MTQSDTVVVHRFLVEEDKETTPQPPARKEASPFPRSVNGKIFIGSGEDGDYLFREHNE